MTGATGDDWTTGNAYEAYMGRWSRLIAREFLTWLNPETDLHWLEIGCGTGALTSSICAQCSPASILACDQSESFVEHARTQVLDPRASFVAASANALPSRLDGFDVIVSGLVLNFVQQPEAALISMRERLGPGGTVAAYVWDYARGVDFLSYFWEEAVKNDPRAAAFDESNRFGVWQSVKLAELFKAAGLVRVEGAVLGIPTRFASFDDFWTPFLGRTGPAPSYVASLTPQKREALAARLEKRLVAAHDGSISLEARALAVRGARS